MKPSFNQLSGLRHLEVSNSPDIKKFWTLQMEEMFLMIIKILLSSQNIQRFLKKLIVQTLNLYIEDMYVNQIVMHGDNVKII